MFDETERTKIKGCELGLLALSFSLTMASAFASGSCLHGQTHRPRILAGAGGFTEDTEPQKEPSSCKWALAACKEHLQGSSYVRIHPRTLIYLFHFLFYRVSAKKAQRPQTRGSDLKRRPSQRLILRMSNPMPEALASNPRKTQTRCPLYPFIHD